MTPLAAHWPRVAVVALLAVTGAFLVQSAVLPAIGLSAGVPVVFATVVVLAMAWGPRVGAIVGFAAGLLLDLTGSGVLGVGALVGCLLGLVGGRIPVDRWRWSGAGWAAVATAVAAVATLLGNALLQGRIPVLSGWLVWVLAGAAVCTVVLLPARPRLQGVVR